MIWTANGIRKLFRFGGQATFKPGAVVPCVFNTASSLTGAFGMGEWANGNNGGTLTTAAISKDNIYAMPFIAPARGGLLQVVSAFFGGAGNARLGIYENVDNENDPYPSALLYGSPAIAVSAVYLGIFCNVQLQPRKRYWAAFNCDTNQAGMLVYPVGGASHYLGMDAAATTTLATCLKVALAYAALPATFTAGGAFTADRPYLQLRYAQ